MNKQAIVHVGVHKTGTTSIQAFIEQNKTILRQNGIEFYTGEHLSNNHVELHMASMRPHRLSPFKMDNHLLVDAKYHHTVRERIHSHFEHSTANRLLFSAEGLSYLRYCDEMERLKALIPTDQIKIIFYVREPDGFLQSYRREMSRHRLPETIDSDCFAYTAADTWLTKFPERIANFSRSFGAENVVVIDYDHEMKTHGNVIPSFIRALDIEDAFHPTSWANLFLNTATSTT